MNVVGIIGVVVVVVVDVVVLVMKDNDAFVVAGFSGMYGYEGHGFINWGPSIDSKTYPKFFKKIIYLHSLLLLNVLPIRDPAVNPTL